ncbi:MAG: glycosyltransferase family 87 protein [Planctomycetota bacterium]
MTPWARALLILILLCAAGVGVERVARGGTSDFDGFWRAGHLAWNEQQLSQDKAVERYPPSFVLILAPLGALPITAAAALFIALNLLALLALPRALEALSGVRVAEQWPAWLLVLPFAIDALALGQNGPVLLWLATWGLARLRISGSVLGGLALGVAAATKIIPAAFLLLPLTLRRARPALVGCLLAGALLCAALFSLGRSWTSSFPVWLEEVQEEHSPAAMVAANRSLRFNNQALPIVLARTFSDLGGAEVKGAVRVSSLPVASTLALWKALVLAAFLLGAVLCWRLRREAGPLVWLRLFGLVCLGVLFVSPLVWTHYFLWWLPAGVALLPRRRMLLGLAVASTLLLASESARALGAHAAISWWLYGLLSFDLLRESATKRRTVEAGTALSAPAATK